MSVFFFFIKIIFFLIIFDLNLLKTLGEKKTIKSFEIDIMHLKLILKTYEKVTVREISIPG